MGLPKDGYFIVCLITILLLFENSETLRSQIGRIYGTNECAVCGMDLSKNLFSNFQAKGEIKMSLNIFR